MEAIIKTILILLILLLLLAYLYQKDNFLNEAKYHGILINGEHYKVYKIYRSSSYTDGGVYINHHDVHDFGEVLLISPKKEKLYVSKSHLKYCLKVRKHNNKMMIDGKMTKRWSEWKIDYNNDDKAWYKSHDIYSWLY